MFSTSRRSFLSLLAAAPLIRDASAGDRAKPNIIVLMADDLSARELGCYGNRDHATPVLDALAREGCKFRTCWATPICRPTRAEIMTGRYGFRTGWYHNQLRPLLGEPNYNLATSNWTFAQLLKRAGYATMICGKWQITGTVEEHAFDEHCLWEGELGIESVAETAGDIHLPQLAPRYWQPAIVENGRPLATTSDDYGPEIFVDFLLDFAARHRDRPQLIYHAMPLAHVAWDFEHDTAAYIELPELDAAGRHTGARQPGSLKSSVEFIDHLVGRIVAGLERLGLYERTVILFTGDNGTARYGKNDTVRERGPRVPLIVNGPGQVVARGSVDALVDLSDVLPTLVELAGGSLPADYALDGKSFAPLLRGRAGPGRPWIFSYLGDRRWVRSRRWLLDGDGQLWDCAERRNERGYLNVTDSKVARARAAGRQFQRILERLPPPPPGLVREAWERASGSLPLPVTISVRS